MDTRILKHGTPIRLFPVVPESCKEQKTLSIVLANLISVRPFAERLFAPLGVKLGKRSELKCFSEVTLTNEVKNLKDRPDALIVVETGTRSWSALVEAKVGKHVVEADQLERYMDLARLNNIDAVITISNQLTPSPDINPTTLQKSPPKNLQLLHLSWASILTTAFLLAAEKVDPYNNDDEAFLISELIRYLEHGASGLVPLDQMNKAWPKLVGDVQAGHPINAKSDEMTEMVTIWLQEARDVALLLTRILKEPVTIAAKRSHLNDPTTWIEHEKREFVAKKAMSFELDVPNTASRIMTEADFLRRCVRVSMKLQAPTDRVSNSARLNWLLRQLSKSNKEKVIIRCITRGKGHNFGAMADEIDPKSEEIHTLGEIVSFEIEMSVDLGARFNSRKKFIESLEEIVPDFYQNVSQHVQAFVPPPPKVKRKEEHKSQDADVLPEELDQPPFQNKKDKGVASENRPPWANQWHGFAGSTVSEKVN